VPRPPPADRTPRLPVQGTPDDLPATRRLPGRGQVFGGRPLLRALAGRRPTQRLQATSCVRRPSTPSPDGDQADRRALDMAMLLMTDVFRKKRPGGRAGRARHGRGLLAYVMPGPRASPRSPLRRRGVLGPRMGPPAARGSTTATTTLYDRLLHEGAESCTVIAGRPRLPAGLVRFLRPRRTPAAATLSPERERRRRSPSRPCPARRCGTRDSSRDGKCGHRSSRSRRRRSPSTRNSSRSTTSWSQRSPHPHAHGGEWQLLDCTAGDNPTHENLVAWSWTTDRPPLVVVNLSERPAQGRVRLPWADLRGGSRHSPRPAHE